MVLEYYIFYKPFQVLSQFSPAGEKQTLARFIEVEKNVYPVGRLDYDSEGLLILTNDTTLNKRLLDPQFGHVRTYWVQVEGTITDAALAQLESGVTITVDGKPYFTLPCKAAIIKTLPDLPTRFPPIRFRKNIPTSWMQLTLTEGKNRQVRKMTAVAGFPTLRLIRQSIEQITLKTCNQGN